MFSAARFVVAGAIVALLGGLVLSAQPFEQQSGSTPGGATAGVPAPLVEVVGRARSQGTCPNEGVRGADVERVGSVTQYRGYQCHPDTVWSDPRLEGTETLMTNFDNYGEDELGSLDLHIGSSVVHIQNDEGGWRSRPTLEVIFPGSSGWQDGASAASVVFIGEGAYEGLIFVGQQVGDATRGSIIEAAIPPDPEDVPGD
jgi:hypothetical protein